MPARMESASSQIYSDRDGAADRRALAGRCAKDELAAERGEAVGDPLEAGAALGGVGVEALPVVDHLESEAPVRLCELDRDASRLRVLRDVLQRLEAGEVH